MASLPDQLKANRLTLATEVGTVPSHWSDLETAIAAILGIVLDSNVTATILGVDPAVANANAGKITKNLVRQIAAGPVGFRIRNSTNDNEFRLVLSGTDVKIEENTGTEATPVWEARLTIAVGTGNMAIPGTLGVTGALSALATLAVTGAVTLSSTLAVTGAVTMGSTLGVTGAATLASAAVTGALTKGGSNVVTTGDSGTITQTMMASASIGTEQLIDGEVTMAKLSSNPLPDQVAGAITVHENDDIVTTTNGYYTKLKESQLGPAAVGTLTISFTLTASTVPSPVVKAKIYRNGVAVGTERTQTGTGSTSFSESIAGWAEDDYVQVYGYVVLGSGNAGVSNVKIKTSNPLWATVVT
jgi:hypothetical protein